MLATSKKQATVKIVVIAVTKYVDVATTEVPETGIQPSINVDLKRRPPSYLIGSPTA